MNMFLCPKCKGPHFNVGLDGTLKCASVTEHSYYKKPGCGWSGTVLDGEKRQYRILFNGHRYKVQVLSTVRHWIFWKRQKWSDCGHLEAGVRVPEFVCDYYEHIEEAKSAIEQMKKYHEWMEAK